MTFPSGDGSGLRTVLAEAALDITPSPPPLEAIARRARARRHRRAAALAASGAALLVAPFVLATAQRAAPPDRAAVPPAAVSSPPSVSPTPSRSVSPVRVVEPDERVTAPGGAELWLTERGKHWALPGEPAQFRSVVDGNIDRRDPGISVQQEGAFLSGLFYGADGVALVTVTTATGPVTASLLTLPGRPGWGVWYAGAATGDTVVDEVTMADASGRTLFSLPLR
ncbi:hypothetical protein [Streptomyces sp. t39]|uniref:hypothetical protein n=1 Tax=Streptomyces sp. t39 TaxID=1828156 RepID=UPI0011CDFF30|nr:hypothetical protein [Streptomyces sp. t39]TXS55343.1 hypothetical protein EAO77_03425 [Streptomyces sp. t39]